VARTIVIDRDVARRVDGHCRRCPESLAGSDRCADSGNAAAAAQARIISFSSSSFLVRPNGPCSA